MNSENFKKSLEAATQITDINELNVLFLMLGKVLAEYNPVQFAESFSTYMIENINSASDKDVDSLTFAMTLVFDKLIAKINNLSSREELMGEWIDYETTLQTLQKKGFLNKNPQGIN